MAARRVRGESTDAGFSCAGRECARPSRSTKLGGRCELIVKHGSAASRERASRVDPDHLKPGPAALADGNSQFAHKGRADS